MDTLRIFTIVGVLLLASHPSGFTGVDGAAVPQNTTSTALPGEISFVVGWVGGGWGVGGGGGGGRWLWKGKSVIW